MPLLCAATAPTCFAPQRFAFPCFLLILLASGSDRIAHSQTVELTEATILELNQALNAGTLTSERLVELYSGRIAAYDDQGPALNAVRDYLDPGESCVGTIVNVRHLAATPVGHWVTAEAEVTKVDGRRIEFKVSARDEIEEIGTGTHERMVVDMARLDTRLAAKKRP